MLAYLQFIAVGICIGVYYFATFCSRYIWEVAEYCDCLGLDRTDERVHNSQSYLERLKWRWVICSMIASSLPCSDQNAQSMRT